jgi:FkbM family methyltransferase
MKTIGRELLVRLFRRTSLQGLLERNVELSLYLMGIGAGSSVRSSGEAAVLRKVAELGVRGSDAPVVFDVGANTGQFVRLVLRELGPLSPVVHSFEPSSRAFTLLENDLGGTPRLHLNNFGLGEAAGTSHLFYNEAGSGLASLYKRRLDHFGIDFSHSERVSLRSLDDYAAEKDVKVIDLLKLDVEGHELAVLSGATRMLRGRRIRMVSFEFGGCNIDSRTFFQDFWYFFQRYGMPRIHRIAPSGDLVQLAGYRELYEQFRTTNYLALPSD